jgi:hypothetical protein
MHREVRIRDMESCGRISIRHLEKELNVRNRELKRENGMTVLKQKYNMVFVD